MATVSEVARLLGVDPDKVKSWAKEYAEYLGLTAQPAKGQERRFSEADLRVLAVIAEHLELGNEADDVHYALNSGRQYDESLLEFARLHSPLFQDPSDELDETWQHGSLIGGMACRDLTQVASAYKLAADELVKQALSKYEPHELDYPVLFLYRHTVELYLKAALENPPEHHDLSRLIQLLEAESGKKFAGWVRDRLWDFHRIDNMAALFHYADPPADGELWIDFHQLQTVIGKIVQAIEQYMEQKRRNDRVGLMAPHDLRRGRILNGP
jgi:DNA-binding transcriptional MerR regulator